MNINILVSQVKIMTFDPRIRKEADRETETFVYVELFWRLISL